jgi:hypothetical protein
VVSCRTAVSSLGSSSQPKVFRNPVYSEHTFLERLNSAIVGFLSPRFRRVFGTPCDTIMNRIETPRNSHFHQTTEGIDAWPHANREFCWKTPCPAADGPSPTLGSLLVGGRVAFRRLGVSLGSDQFPSDWLDGHSETRLQ